MADNVPITAGSGTSIAADDVSSVYYQRVKLDAGGDGASTPILAGGGVEASALRVTIANDSTGKIETVGDVAADAAITANPLTIGGRASSALPTAMSADGDAVNAWLTRSGATVAAVLPHLGRIADPYTLTAKTAQYTTTQTGTALWTPASGKKLVITQVQIQVGGTTAGTVQLWFGGSADTTYSRGTDLAIFDGEFAPSATLKPGVVMDGLWIAAAADDVLRVTDSAAVNPITFTVWGYEI